MDSMYLAGLPTLDTFYAAGHPPIMPPPPPELLQPPSHHQLHTLAPDHFPPYPDHPDSNLPMPPQHHPSQRARRRQLAGADHVKHRRTRSGCYTCRQRRVKCDEARPICARCSKGKRDCHYPESSSSSRPVRRDSRLKGTGGESESSPSDEDNEGDERHALDDIPDDEDYDYDETEPHSAASDTTTGSAIPSLQQQTTDPAASASTTLPSRSSRPTASRQNSKQSVQPAVSNHSRWSALTKEDRSYLRYYQDNLTYHHYAFKYDGSDFLKTTYLDIAMNDQSQALIYSIIAFAAYHRSIERADFRISIFLSYYNKSIVLLQQSLKSKKPGVATLLTVLQLATIEEFLGDWSNLLGHQKAAHQILIDLYTPKTIMQDETRRRIIAWYIRFDLFAGMMSGSETRLGREWFAACHEHYQRQAKDRPNDLAAMFEEYFSTSRLLATDVALLFAEKVKGTISDEEFGMRINDLLMQFASFEKRLESTNMDPSNYVKDFPKSPPPSPEEITNFRDPYFLLNGDLFTMNFVLLDFWAIDLMFKYNMTKVTGQDPSKQVELTQIALKTCKMFEAIQYSSESPPGAIIGCQASLGIASLFLPKDARHTMWARRKYVLIEKLGYIYPPNLRKQLSETWGVDVNQWWLPNNEDYPYIVRAVREFIDYRSEVPRDMMEAHVRNMSGLFRSMHVDEQSSSAGTDTERLSPAYGTAWESSPEQVQHWQGGNQG